MREKEAKIPVTKETRMVEKLGPVKMVWAVCNAMPTAGRKAVLEACRRLGVNPNTASTQYQLWGFARRQAKAARHLPDTVQSRIMKAVNASSPPQAKDASERTSRSGGRPPRGRRMQGHHPERAERSTRATW